MSFANDSDDVFFYVSKFTGDFFERNIEGSFSKKGEGGYVVRDPFFLKIRGLAAVTS